MRARSSSRVVGPLTIAALVVALAVLWIVERPASEQRLGSYLGQLVGAESILLMSVAIVLISTLPWVEVWFDGIDRAAADEIEQIVRRHPDVGYHLVRTSTQGRLTADQALTPFEGAGPDVSVFMCRSRGDAQDASSRFSPGRNTWPTHTPRAFRLALAAESEVDGWPADRLKLRDAVLRSPDAASMLDVDSHLRPPRRAMR